MVQIITYPILSAKKVKTQPPRSESGSSRIWVNSMERILGSLKFNHNRNSTNKNYVAIWRQLNDFILKLDHIPEDWEDRISLFCAHLIEHKKVKSTTLKSYISAMKHILKCDGYKWRDDKV